MAYKHREGSGSLFRNRSKTSEKQPDYTGTANFEGTIIRLAGWIQPDKPGFLSLKVSRPMEQGERPQAGRARPVDDSDVPF